MPTFVFSRPEDEDAFYRGAAERGVLFFQDDAQCPSAAHGEAEVEETMRALEPLLASLASDAEAPSGDAKSRATPRVA